MHMRQDTYDAVLDCIQRLRHQAYVSTKDKRTLDVTVGALELLQESIDHIYARSDKAPITRPAEAEKVNR